MSALLDLDDDVAEAPVNGHAHPEDYVISFVQSGTSTVTAPVSFRSIISRIASDEWREQVYGIQKIIAESGKDAAKPAKVRLPGVCFSGNFSYRSDTDLIKHSGLICADVDNVGPELMKLRDAIVADPHTLACFVSPSGNGLKVVLRCDPAKLHHESFAAMKRHMKDRFGIEIDVSGKNVSRLCFVSHDPEAYLAHTAPVLPYPEPEKDAPPVEFRAPMIMAPTTYGEISPGDDYDARGDIAGLLLQHGWSKSGQHGWTRPGKPSGISATWDKVPRRFYVFSDATGFEPNHVYRPWHVFAVLECGGDFKRAAGELAKHGFGTQRQERMSPRIQTEEIAPRVAPAPLSGRSFMSFAMPPKDDPSILLGNRFLCRGDGGILASTSGMGKSSLSLQAATTWALGRPLFGGLDPHGRALKSLIFQAEDSDGDMAEVKFSMIHAMRLTAEEQEQVAANVIIITDRIHRGLSFLAELRRQIAIHKPDIVWINPLLAFIGGDVNDAKAAGEFLREGLNSLNEPASFAYIVIHHTAKPPKERADRKWNEVMYEMAGSADLTNWARFVISLRASETEGRFNLVFAKRGVRAGFTKPSITGNFKEPVTVLGLRHSKERMEVDGQSLPVIHWEMCEAETEQAQPAAGKAGRRPKYDFNDFKAVFPKLSEAPETLAIIQRKAEGMSGIKPQTFRDLCQRAHAEGLLERTESKVSGFRYRLADHPPHGATATV